VTRELSSAFSIRKTCSWTKLAQNLKRNCKMMCIVFIVFNFSVSTFGMGEKMKNNQVDLSLDSLTRKLALALITGYFIQLIQLLRPLMLHIRWYFATCEIHLGWKTFIFDGSRGLGSFFKTFM
jgi:hypothetical protein